MKEVKNIILAGLIRDKTTGFITGRISNIMVEAYININSYKVSIKVGYQTFTGIVNLECDNLLSLTSETNMANIIVLKFMKPAIGIKDCSTFKTGLETALNNAFIISNSGDISAIANSYDDKSFKATDQTEPGQYALKYNNRIRIFTLSDAKGKSWQEKSTTYCGDDDEEIKFENGLSFNSVRGFGGSGIYDQITFTICGPSYILLDIEPVLKNLKKDLLLPPKIIFSAENYS